MKFDLQSLRRLDRFELFKALKVQLEIRPTLRGVPYWVAAVLVGFVAVLYSGAFSSMIATSQSIAKNHPLTLFALSPSCFLISTWLVWRVAPAAGGTGVPVVTRVLELDPEVSEGEIDRCLNLRVATVVVLSSLLAVLGAGGLGREGPMIHIAACVFYYVARKFTGLWPYQEHRSWVVAGGAAGVAAAFNTPLAGIVFVLEELAQQHFHQFKTVVISAVIVAGMMAQWLSGKYLFLGYPRIDGVSFSTVPYAILVGVACGLGAGVFLLLIRWSTDKTKPLLDRHRFLFAGTLGLLVAALAVYVDRRTIGGGIGAVQELLFTGEKASWGLLLGRFASTWLAHLAGVAGGFLAPALSLGAAIGSKVAWWLSPTDHNLLVLVGMAGFLSAITRAPFTALVIVMEMTDRHSAIFPLMITSLISLGISKAVAQAWADIQT